MPSLSTLRNTAVAVMALLLGVFIIKEEKPNSAAEIEVSLKELDAVVKENKQNSNPQKPSETLPASPLAAAAPEPHISDTFRYVNPEPPVSLPPATTNEPPQLAVTATLQHQNDTAYYLINISNVGGALYNLGYSSEIKFDPAFPYATHLKPQEKITFLTHASFFKSKIRSVSFNFQDKKKNIYRQDWKIIRNADGTLTFSFDSPQALK